MSIATATLLVNLLALYAALGILVAVIFALGGAKRIDPDGAAMTPGARLIVLPGIALLWPLMLFKLFTQTEPPIQ
ncbi:MAG: hypothetical protein AB8F65_07630 [Woeseiaceae bacterium]